MAFKRYIYALSDENGIIYYIGQTKNLKTRGAEPSDVIDEVESEDDYECRRNALATESYWIDQFRAWGFNLENKKYGRKPIPAEDRIKGVTVYLTPADKERVMKHFKSVTAAITQVVLPECDLRDNQIK